MSLSNNFPAVRPTLLLDFARARQLDPRITFTRATTATYYDGSTTALAEQNLLLYSQDFDQASNWLPVALTVTANTTAAPDGTTTADTFTAQAGSNRHYLNAAGTPSVTAGTTLTFTVFARAGTNSFMQIYSENSLSDRYANFDLTLGTVTQSGASTTATITSAGGSWWRCRVTYTAIAVANGNMAIDVIPTGTSARGTTWTALGTETILVWGAQYEQRATPTAYTATTTAVIANYIPVLVTAAANVARFDHNPSTGASLGLLIEEARTNLVSYSAEFDNAYWNKSASSITANTVVAPDGTLAGDKLVEDTATAQHFVGRAGVMAVSTQYTISVYAKAAERTIILLGGVRDDGAFQGRYFDLSSGTTTASFGTPDSWSIVSVGNGWYRCIVTLTNSATGTSDSVGVYLVSSGTTTNYTGNGFNGAFIWGFQLEAGAFATSYIPTVASSVPRNADFALMTGTNFSSWYNNSQGTWLINYVERAFSVAHQMIYTTVTGDTSNRINVSVNSSNVLDVQVVAAGTDSFGGNTPTLTAQAYQLAFAYATNNSGVTVNASAITTDTGVTLPTGVDRLAIGSTTGGAQQVNSTLAKIAYYDVRLTNAQLQALTAS